MMSECTENTIPPTEPIKVAIRCETMIVCVCVCVCVSVHLNEE
jgi:hypothetical protein